MIKWSCFHTHYQLRNLYSFVRTGMNSVRNSPSNCSHAATALLSVNSQGAEHEGRKEIGIAMNSQEFPGKIHACRTFYIRFLFLQFLATPAFKTTKVLRGKTSSRLEERVAFCVRNAETHENSPCCWYD